MTGLGDTSGGGGFLLCLFLLMFSLCLKQLSLMSPLGTCLCPYESHHLTRHPCIHSSIHLPNHHSYTSTHLSIHPHIHLPTHPPPTHTLHPFICLPTIHPFIYPPIHTSIHPPIYLHLPIHPSTHLLVSFSPFTYSSSVYQTIHSSTRYPPMHTPTRPNGHSATYSPSSPTHHLFIHLFIHQHTDLSTQPLIYPAI